MSEHEHTEPQPDERGDEASEPQEQEEDDEQREAEPLVDGG